MEKTHVYPRLSQRRDHPVLKLGSLDPFPGKPSSNWESNKIAKPPTDFLIRFNLAGQLRKKIVFSMTA
jgi:hypothetical protein